MEPSHYFGKVSHRLARRMPLGMPLLSRWKAVPSLTDSVAQCLRHLTALIFELLLLWRDW